MNPLLIIGLSFFAGGVFGYAFCLWRWCMAEEERLQASDDCMGFVETLQAAEQERKRQGGQVFTNIPLPPLGASQTRIYGGSGKGFVVAHDCLKERCRTPHGGVK